MIVIIVLVFLGVFAVRCVAVDREQRAPPSRPSRCRPRWTRHWRPKPRRMRDQIVNLRKSDQLSSIPWLNQEAAEVRTDALSAEGCSIRPI